jgi:sporulation protein YtfJ
MSQKLPNMLESTIQKIREMLDVNTVVGTPITTPDGVTIIPVSKVSVGFGGGGSDFASKNAENPFGGGVGGGVKVSPIAFLIVKDGNVRMLPVASAPNTTSERIVEMIPDLLDKVSALLDKKNAEKAE